MSPALRALILLAGAAASLGGPPAAAQQLGRLFFTPEQRAALDARRKARVPDKPAAVVAASPTMRLDGFVQRSSGRSTIWVNREALDERSPEAPRIAPGGDPRVTVGVGESRARISLKPGETLDRGNGEVRDVISNGEIRVRRAGRELGGDASKLPAERSVFARQATLPGERRDEPPAALPAQPVESAAPLPGQAAASSTARLVYAAEEAEAKHRAQAQQVQALRAERAKGVTVPEEAFQSALALERRLASEAADLRSRANAAMEGDAAAERGAASPRRN